MQRIYLYYFGPLYYIDNPIYIAIYSISQSVLTKACPQVNSAASGIHISVKTSQTHENAQAARRSDAREGEHGRENRERGADDGPGVQPNIIVRPIHDVEEEHDECH